MSEKKSLRERQAEQKTEILDFWGTPRGLITAGIVIVGVVVFAAWSATTGLVR